MLRPKSTPPFPSILRAWPTLGSLAVLSLIACSETPGNVGGSGGAPGSGGAAVGSGGAASGGATGTGGAPGTGGSSTGGGSSGGSASGGGSSGGASSGGGSSGGASSSGGNGSGGGGSEAFELAVTDVDATDNDDCDDGAEASCPLFPEDTTSFGENVSPAMAWGAGPEGTLSYALTLVDLSNNDFAHWALWDIPAETLALPAELPAGGTLTTPVAAKQASGIGSTEVYFGSGACGNVYEFRLYALDTATLTPANAADPASVVTALGALTPLGETFVRVQSRDYCP